MLSCECDYDIDSGQWYYYYPDDFSVFSGIGKHEIRKRCYSCKELIDVGATCVEFERIRMAYGDIDARIAGEEYKIPPVYMCEKCGEIWLNLNALGYCMEINTPMRDYLLDYQKMTGFKGALKCQK